MVEFRPARGRRLGILPSQSKIDLLEFINLLSVASGSPRTRPNPVFIWGWPILRGCQPLRVEGYGGFISDPFANTAATISKWIVRPPRKLWGNLICHYRPFLPRFLTARCVTLPSARSCQPIWKRVPQIQPSVKWQKCDTKTLFLDGKGSI